MNNDPMPNDADVQIPLYHYNASDGPKIIQQPANLSTLDDFYTSVSAFCVLSSKSAFYFPFS